MNPQAAVEAPRFASNNVLNSFYPALLLPRPTRSRRRVSRNTSATSSPRKGHDITVVDGAGVGATVSKRDPNTGVLSTSADPRRACYALSW